MPLKTSLPFFAITTGDVDGVGLEVTTKALLKNSFRSHFVIFLSPQSENFYIQKLLSLNSSCIITSEQDLIRSIKQIKKHQNKKNSFLLFITNNSPQENVSLAARLCNDKILSGLITAPMSKRKIKLNNKIQTSGHTEILKSISTEKNLFMTFLGEHLNVLLVTDHIGLNEASKKFKNNLDQALKKAIDLSQKLGFKTIGVLGLNPHSGERGLIGNLEDIFITKTVQKFEKKYVNLNFIYPISPDAAFMPHMRGKIDLYVAQYHDQGLIPFKALHGFTAGVHITSGLKFIRTSVDHGTAKDIFGKNKADSTSMSDAIRFALKMHTTSSRS